MNPGKCVVGSQGRRGEGCLHLCLTEQQLATDLADVFTACHHKQTGLARGFWVSWYLGSVSQVLYHKTIFYQVLLFLRDTSHMFWQFQVYNIKVLDFKGAWFLMEKNGCILSLVFNYFPPSPLQLGPMRTTFSKLPIHA